MDDAMRTAGAAAESIAKPTGVKARQKWRGGDRRDEHLREAKSPRQYRLVDSIGPVRKSYSGAGRSHGTVRPRGQTPGAAATSLWSTPQALDPATMKLAVARGETAGGCETSEQASSPVDGSKTAKGVSESHGRRRDFDGPGQVARTVRRGSGTSAERNRSRMTRADGVSQARKRKATETRGAKNRTGEPTSWRGCRGWEQRRSGMVRSRSLRAVRRDQ